MPQDNERRNSSIYESRSSSFFNKDNNKTKAQSKITKDERSLAVAVATDDINEINKLENLRNSLIVSKSNFNSNWNYFESKLNTSQENEFKKGTSKVVISKNTTSNSNFSKSQSQTRFNTRKEILVSPKQNDEHEQIINCIKLEKTVLTESSSFVKISISKPEKNAGGFFSSDFVTYLVSTDPHKFQVRRRYSDFLWLRNILLDFFPGIMIPPIPSKNYGQRLHEDFIQQRMRYLEVSNF